MKKGVDWAEKGFSSLLIILENVILGELSHFSLSKNEISVFSVIFDFCWFICFHKFKLQPPSPPSPLLSPPTAGSNVLTYHNHFIPHALYLQVDVLFVFNFWNCTHTHTPITATVSHTHEPRTFAHEPACIQRALNIMWICETNRLIFFFSFSGDYDSRKLTLGG